MWRGTKSWMKQNNKRKKEFNLSEPTYEWSPNKKLNQLCQTVWLGQIEKEPVAASEMMEISLEIIDSFLFAWIKSFTINQIRSGILVSLSLFIHRCFFIQREKKERWEKRVTFFFPGPWRGSDLLINCVIRAVFCVGHYQWSNLLDLFFFACCFAETVLGNLFD